MKILLLGANGQVGFELHRSLAPLGSVIAATRTGELPGDVPCERADLADPQGIAALVARTAPDWVVNAAAYTAVDRAETERELALRINAEAVGAIGHAARNAGACVLHFSTDYVFDGTSDAPYREQSDTTPVNHYGATKLAGEHALRDSGARHVVLRTAWVYGARGRNFLRTMLDLARTRDTIRVVADQLGSPTPARLLADVVAQVLPRLGADASDASWGTFHAAASGRTSWHGFATELFARAAAAGLVARAPTVVPIPGAEYPAPARRPASSVLDCARLEGAFGLALPDWRAGVARCISELAAARASHASIAN